MSASRCIKLLHMMGLHRLDDPNARLEMAPTIAPPKDWIELEGSYDVLALNSNKVILGRCTNSHPYRNFCAIPYLNILLFTS